MSSQWILYFFKNLSICSTDSIYLSLSLSLSQSFSFSLSFAYAIAKAQIPPRANNLNLITKKIMPQIVIYWFLFLFNNDIISIRIGYIEWLFSVGGAMQLFSIYLIIFNGFTYLVFYSQQMQAFIHFTYARSAGVKAWNKHIRCD